jgi:hypothetical protein
MHRAEIDKRPHSKQHLKFVAGLMLFNSTAECPKRLQNLEGRPDVPCLKEQSLYRIDKAVEITTISL